VCPQLGLIFYEIAFVLNKEDLNFKILFHRRTDCVDQNNTAVQPIRTSSGRVERRRGDSQSVKKFNKSNNILMVILIINKLYVKFNTFHIFFKNPLK